jgi:polysaccharide export outer membrane protein
MKLFFYGLSGCALLLAGVFFTGCASSPNAVFFSDPTQPATTSSVPQDVTLTNSAMARFSVGDTVNVSLSDAGPDFIPQTYAQIIKEDGTITISPIGSIQAAGKTAGELQTAIHDLYVPQYYVRLTVTVKSSDDRVYYVGGEVNSHGSRQLYVGATTVTKAIQSAGGLTDFANHGKVWLIRSTGQRIKVNYDKALEDSTQDPPVYPGDQVNVERRIW